MVINMVTFFMLCITKVWLTVAADGSGDYRTVQAALDAATAGCVITVKAGVYREKLQLDSAKDHVTLIGEDAATTILTYDDHPGMVAPNGDSINTRNSYSFRVLADDFTARNITFRNDAGFSAGQAVGVEARGDRAVFVNCRIIGNQDILFLNSDRSRQYYDSCYIEGTTDFIFGSATAWFEHCHIHSKKNSHVTAASTPREHPYGFAFDHCTLTGDSTLDRVSLGRPWRPYASVVYLHCWLGGHIFPDGWANWNKTDNYKTTRYAEFDNEGPGAKPAARVTWSRQLSASEAARITPHTVFGDWNPAEGDITPHAVSGDWNPASAAPDSPRDYSWTNLPVIHQPSFKKDTFDITNYGAIADGITVNTTSIQSTIDACSDKGGGVVLIPSGLWVTGPIVMRSDVNLHLDRAAILQFSANKDLYPILAGNWEGHPAARCQSPISGADLQNIAITGGGIIDGNGDSWRWIAKERLSEAEWKQRVASGGVVTEDGKTWFPSAQSLKGYRIKEAGVLKPGMSVSDFNDIRDFLRPNLVVLTNCKGVLLEGASFQNSAAWCLHTLLCEDLTVYDVHVRNPWYAVNGDGIDVESCKGVLIEKSTFDAGDDGICVKSGRDEEGRKRGRPTENMIVRDDIVYRAHGGFVIGSEMSGGARNIFVSHCSFIGTDIGLRFKTVRGRGGLVEKIYVKDISMRNIVHQAVFLDMYYFAKAPSIADVYSGAAKADTASVSEATPRFRDIHISNIVCDGAEEGIFVRGLPEMNIRDIDLSDMVLKTAKGAELIEAQHIGLRNIRLVTSDSTPVVYIENSSDLQFENMHYNKGAGLLFSINGAKCANIRVSDTDISKAVHNAAFNYGAAAASFKND
jgi:polygalacturonase/pectin methylesterase-like acyl-CoA thioesterase